MGEMLDECRQPSMMALIATDTSSLQDTRHRSRHGEYPTPSPMRQKQAKSCNKIISKLHSLVAKQNVLTFSRQYQAE